MAIGQLALNAIVLFVALGRWGGRMETRRPTSVTKPEPQTNGTPSLGELVRWRDGFEVERRALVRSADMEDRLRIRDDANRREHEDIWGAIKDLRSVDSTQQRRIDALMGK
jgi:hypothetical protein